MLLFVAGLRRLYSGPVGDQVAWLTLGALILAATSAAACRTR